MKEVKVAKERQQQLILEAAERLMRYQELLDTYTKGGDEMQYTLKELRARKGMNQSEVAKELGVSVQTYGAWEADFGIV